MTSEQTSNPAFLLLHFQFYTSIRIVVVCPVRGWSST
jgi:hypothetical protein